MENNQKKYDTDTDRKAAGVCVTVGQEGSVAGWSASYRINFLKTASIQMHAVDFSPVSEFSDEITQKIVKTNFSVVPRFSFSVLTRRHRSFS